MGSNAVAGHIHAAALPGVNAPVLFGMNPPSGTSGAVNDLFFAVTPAQAADLKRGQLYFNIHTTNFPGGEIRAQILSANRFGDFDADGRAELAVFRPGDDIWYTLNPGTNAFRAQQWGSSSTGDRTLPADFDGDGKADYAVWRASNGTYYILYSATNTFRAQQWGNFALVPPIPPDDPRNTCDYDGDGKADIAVFRRSGAEAGMWYILRSSNGSSYSTQFGTTNDNPVSSFLLR